MAYTPSAPIKIPINRLTSMAEFENWQDTNELAMKVYTDKIADEYHTKVATGERAFDGRPRLVESCRNAALKQYNRAFEAAQDKLDEHTELRRPLEWTNSWIESN